MWSDTSLGWLIHSAPCWPCALDVTSVSPLDVGETHFGQSFVWLDLDRALLPDVMHQLALMQPDLCFAHNCTEVWKPIKSVPVRTFQTLQLAPELSHVAKHSRWGKELYEEGLSPTFGGSLTVETWLRPPCPATKHAVDVECLSWKVSGPNGQPISFHESADHSKWCVSDAGWSFIGDINRMTSQCRRGGGGVVLKDPVFWKLMSDMIVGTKPRDPPKVQRLTGCQTGTGKH